MLKRKHIKKLNQINKKYPLFANLAIALLEPMLGKSVAHHWLLKPLPQAPSEALLYLPFLKRFSYSRKGATRELDCF
jgi:hypothetical protein